jgi:uncharacterized protein with PIN domain
MSSQATFRFYAELNDFLPVRRRQVPFSYEFQGQPSIKDAIEALGVPHTEVDLILINGNSVDFTHPVSNGDQVSIYPVFEGLDITPLVRLRPHPLRNPGFVLDTHLGRLAAYLRLLGFDSLYRNDYGDEELAGISSTQRRILLTKDRGLLKRKMVTRGYCVRSSNPRLQIKEVIERFNLVGAVSPFKRCLRCNGLLEAVAREAIMDRLPAEASRYYQEFYRCTQCQQLYWRGSHYEALQRKIVEFLDKDQ